MDELKQVKDTLQFLQLGLLLLDQGQFPGKLVNELGEFKFWINGTKKNLEERLTTLEATNGPTPSESTEN